MYMYIIYIYRESYENVFPIACTALYRLSGAVLQPWAHVFSANMQLILKETFRITGLNCHM